MSKLPENAQYALSAKFRKRLADIMDENDCGNVGFAELTGVSYPVISKAANYGIVPSTRALTKIADALQTSLPYLLGDSDVDDFHPAAFPSSFHTRVAELAEEKGVNYGQIARKMTFPRTYFYEWQKKGTLPSLDYLMAIADYFEVSPDYLLGRTDCRK